MYGHNTSALTLATAMPLSVGAAFAAGWIAMALITTFFLLMSLYQLVRPSARVRP